MKPSTLVEGFIVYGILKTMKAWIVEVEGFPKMYSFYAAPPRGKAHAACHTAANEAGYNVKWTEISVKRCIQFDELAKNDSKQIRSLGWIDENGVWYGDIMLHRAEAEGVIL